MVFGKSIDILKSAGRFYGSLFKEIFPWQKEKILEKLDELKEYYQERIEQKTGKDLGDITLKGYSSIYKDFIYQEIIDDLERVKDIHCSPDKIIKECNKKLYIGFAIQPAIDLFVNLFSFTHGGSYDLEQNNINVKLGSFTRAILELSNDSKRDGILMHELTHALWHSINKEKRSKDKEIRKIEKEWVEGFAEYGARKHFKEFYINDLTFPHIGGGSLKGLIKVERLIADCGENVYLEIPNRWKEFEEVSTGEKIL